MKKGAALLMLVPSVAFFLLTFAIPMVLVGRLSFFKTDYVTSAFVGFQNFINAFKDHYFMKSFANAFWFVLFITPPIIVGAYATASLLSGFPEKVQGAARFVIYIPGLASGLVMALLWGWILLRQGLLNQITGLVGIPQVPWLAQPWTARASISLIIVTSGIGGLVIMFSASMHSIPKELKDAARIDGATERQYKRHIVLPLMTPTILLCVLLEIVGVMQMFETVFVLTGEGGPQGSTASPVYEVFLTAFRFGKSGFAAAKGMILMVAIALILVVKQRVEKWVR